MRYFASVGGTAVVTQVEKKVLDSIIMCHLMPWWHLPEWREEEEQAFVHCGSSGLMHTITSESDTELSKCHPSFDSDFMYMQLTVAGKVGLGLYLVSNCQGVQIPVPLSLTTLTSTTVASSSICHLSPVA